jgi:hypothetical protein
MISLAILGAASIFFLIFPVGREKHATPTPGPRRRDSVRPGDGVEIVEQRGNAAAVRLVHDRPGAAGGGDHVEAADALLDAASRWPMRLR